jgi:hypothetical protein
LRLGFAPGGQNLASQIERSAHQDARAARLLDDAGHRLVEICAGGGAETQALGGFNDLLRRRRRNAACGDGV